MNKGGRPQIQYRDKVVQRRVQLLYSLGRKMGRRIEQLRHEVLIYRLTNRRVSDLAFKVMVNEVMRGWR